MRGTAVARGVLEQPPSPPALDPSGFFDDLVEELKAQLQQDPAVLLLASDGSEHHRVGSFAVCVQPGTYRCATGNGDEDQTAYKQELLGFEIAARALHEAAAATRWTGRVIFVLDCQSALQAVLGRSLRFNYLLKLVEKVRNSLRALDRLGV